LIPPCGPHSAKNKEERLDRGAAFENSIEVKGIMGIHRLDYKGREQNPCDKTCVEVNIPTQHKRPRGGNIFSRGWQILLHLGASRGYHSLTHYQHPSLRARKMDGAFVVAMLIGILIFTLIGAVMLRAAIALYNLMAGGSGSPSSVPEPPMGKAMGITLVTAIVNYAVQYVIKQVGLQAPGGLNALLFFMALSFVASLIVMAIMLTTMLPTSVGRAILVTLCYLLVCIILAAAIIAVLALAFGFKLMN
jgi:hypothetical protein